MKPITLLKQKELTKGWRTCQANTDYSISPYLYEDCVIAYRNGIYGFVFIIKTTRSFMAFYGVNNNFYLGGIGYSFRRIYRLKKAIELLNLDCGNGKRPTILNQELYDKMQTKIMFDELKKED
jgi:hypothetical protein